MRHSQVLAVICKKSIMTKCLTVNFVFMIVTLNMQGQTIACDSVYTIVEQMPVYRKSISDFYHDLGTKLKFDKECRPEDLTGVTWIIDKEGRMIDIEVIALKEECKSTIVNQLQTFPKWMPGKQGAKKVCVRMTMPVHIRGSRLR